MGEKGWSECELRRYPGLPELEPVPRVPYHHPHLMQYLSNHKPVVITESDLTAPCTKWDLDYMTEHMKDAACTVVFSNNHQFKYFDEKLADKARLTSDFVPPTRKEHMTVGRFKEKLHHWVKGQERMYLQQTLNSTVGDGIVRDFVNFNWRWATEIQKKMNWGPLTSNLLLISQQGNVTPCHYDEQHNLFSQVKGYKRFILFPPERFDCLYPYPIYHPHDRQSQVDFDCIDERRFPRVCEATGGQETVLGPGDLLYLPIYWWHHVESLLSATSLYTVSINFWYKAGPTGTLSYPLRGDQKVAIMRNVEKMLLEALKDPAEVGPLLTTMVLGRYYSLDTSSKSNPDSDSDPCI